MCIAAVTDRESAAFLASDQAVVTYDERIAHRLRVGRRMAPRLVGAGLTGRGSAVGVLLHGRRDERACGDLRPGLEILCEDDPVCVDDR